MGGFNIPQGQDLGGAMQADPMMRKRLLSMVMGSDGSLPDRISDDPVSRQPQPENFVDKAPELAQASRNSLINQVRQPAPPDQGSRLQSEYDQVGQQLNAPPQKRSKLKDMLMGALAGPGAGAAIRGRQQGEQFQQNQLRERQSSLLSQIEAERRMQEQEQLSTDRMSLQERMQSERERAAQGSQERVFGQQQDLELQRETLRQKMAQDAEGQRQSSQAAMFDQQDKRQNATFAEQEKLANIREQNKKVDAKPSADEQRRADLGNNMKENLDQLEEIVRRRRDLFGPLAGRKVEAQQDTSWWNPFSGTTDKDVAALKAIKEYLGMASVGTHSMRNAQHVGAAADAVMSGFRNSPEATLAAIQDARKSIETFMQDVEQPGRAGKGIPNRGTGPTPQTHSFSLSAWQRANPKGDANAAKAAAQKAGYEVAP